MFIFKIWGKPFPSWLPNSFMLLRDFSLLIWLKWEKKFNFFKKYKLGEQIFTSWGKILLQSLSLREYFKGELYTQHY